MRRNDREIADIHIIEEYISRADVCRIALADGNIPYIVTMNFGYTGNPENKLFFHCAREGRKMDMIRKNNYVCFEMDIDHQLYPGRNGCDWGMMYSSVVGYGNISIITDNEAKRKGFDCILKHYGGNKDNSYDEKMLDRTVLLQLDIIEMTGKNN